MRGRSREGAWIEITIGAKISMLSTRRSREGAWIEITPGALLKVNPGGRSREGAWIEIICQIRGQFRNLCVAPARERGLKLKLSSQEFKGANVAPARERGLKFSIQNGCRRSSKSLPRGSVD